MYAPQKKPLLHSFFLPVIFLFFEAFRKDYFGEPFQRRAPLILPQTGQNLKASNHLDSQ
jgi:hypothetical protein